MSTDSIFGAIDAAISGEAADTSKKNKERKAAASGKPDQGFIPALVSTIMGNNGKDAPGSTNSVERAGAITGSTPNQPAASVSPKTTGMADGVDGKVAPQTEDPQGPIKATDAAVDPQAAAKQSGEDTIALLLKIFGMG